MSNGPESDPKI